MYNKYAAKEFGTCPLVQCAGQPVLPVGLKDEMGADTVKIYCPKCQCVYHPPPVRSRSSSHHNSTGAAGVDGAAFGTTFPHLFLMTFSNLVPDRLPAASAYVPRVFGFRVHVSARQKANVGPASVTSSTKPSDGPGAMAKRLPFTRRSGGSIETAKDGTSAVKGEDDTIAKEGAGTSHSNDATNDSTSKSIKELSPSLSQVRAGEDDEGSRKSKSGKRRAGTDGDASSKGNGIGSTEGNNTISKRRRKTENGNT